MTEILRARENWLNDAVAQLRPKFEEVGAPLPKLRVSVGYGPAGAKFENSKILGVTITPQVVEDEAYEIFISPEVSEMSRVLDILLHELIHTVSWEDGHKGKFAEYATRLGLTGKMTATTASPELADSLTFLSIELGAWPGSFIDFSKVTAGAPSPVPAGSGPMGGPRIAAGFPRISTGPKKQSTRMLKVECTNQECPAKPNGRNYSVRTTRAMLNMGSPKCPMGHTMHEV